jgi:type I restriction enzyme M protein
MMHVDQPNIDYKDTLSKSYNEDAQFDIILLIHTGILTKAT